MRKNCLLVITSLLFSVFSFSQDICGIWDFKSILADSVETGTNLKNISNGDCMQINKDGSFNYKLINENLIANGTWKLVNDNLSLHYTIPKDTIRTYHVNNSGNHLVLNENGINFSFTKREFKATTVATSGISIYSIFRGIIGIFSLLFIAFLFSRNKKEIDWQLVTKGLGVQLLFAILILKIPFISTAFEFVGKIFAKTISFTQEGTMFLFRSFETGVIESPLMNFAIMILPTVIFFSALTSLFYYWGILPKIVYGFAWVMRRTLKISGPESVAAAGNIFLGQTEAPLLVKPYLNKMTMSEMLCLMTGGMATIAGGVLAAYIGFLGGDDVTQQIVFAKHLLAASVMSAPAAIIAVKILLPETEDYKEELKITKSNMGSNALEAISQGTTDGLKLAINVGTMLLVFIALMSMANYMLLKIGDWTMLNDWLSRNTRYSELSFNMILGYIGAPIAWLIGVCKQDMFLVGQLLGEKTVLNEFVAYVSLGEMKTAGEFVEQKSIIIATYVLCGFANFASIGIQIGGIGALAPNRRADLSKLGVTALIGGTIASLFTAVIVGMLI